MLGITFVVLAALGLGLAFFSIAQSADPAVKRRGPWLLGAAACCLATIVLETHDRGFGILFRLRPDEVKALLVGACVIAGLGVEAVLISRWVLARLPGRTSYLIVFSCVTLFAWLATGLALLDFIPGS